MNGWPYLRPGESLDKARSSLVAAHAMLPSQAEIKLMSAQAYVMLGDEEKANPMLQSLIAWDEGSGAEAASKLLDQTVPSAGDEQYSDNGRTSRRRIRTQTVRVV
jgi:thioredoxin-like negative regulator of GroEL